MSLILCTPDGDFAIVNNQMWLTSTAPASVLASNNGGKAITAVQQEALQLVRAHLRTFAKEIPLNQGLGVPYIQQLLLKGVRDETVVAVLRDAILRTPGILAILSFSMVRDRHARTATITFTARTSAGPITSTQSFP
jgi:hypothetical protein